MDYNGNLFTERENILIEKTGKKFTTIYQKYYPKLIYFTSKICNDHQKAEDIATESFMIALDKIDKYDKEKSQFSTWLFTIAKNLSLQEIKNDKKTISIDIEYDNEGTTMKDFINNDVEETEYFRSIYDKKSDIMKKYMLELKEPYRTVIEMREIKKMAYKDIADILNKPLSTIKSQIRNGRHLLISKSKKEFENIDNIYL
jgi:RNA polymerase sigma-70 factor (ECF subfamily)